MRESKHFREFTFTLALKFMTGELNWCRMCPPEALATMAEVAPKPSAQADG